MSNKVLENNIQLIDIKALIKSKNPKLLRILPFFVLNYIKRIIHQDELNEIIIQHNDKYGLDFVEAVLCYFNININVIGKENVPATGRFVFASNHPLGGFDGLIFISAISKICGEVRFIVNDLLMNLKNLSTILVPVNKQGRHSHEYAKIIEQLYQSDVQVLTCPAGLVSRKISGKIIDLPWHKNFITKAVKHKRDIIPVHISGRNSNFFYNLSNLRKFFGIKANLEIFYLADEVFKQKNKTFTLRIGNPISYKLFNPRDSGLSYDEWAEKIKDNVYAMA